MNDLKRKLSSRKFWAALGGFVCAMCVLFGIDEMATEKLLAVISSMGVLAAYIFTEGYIDAQNKK